MSDRPKYHLDAIFNPTTTHPDDSHQLQMRLIPPNSRVLELGCASGYMSGYLEQMKQCRVVGLDYDPKAVAIAQTRCSAAYTADLDAENPLRLAQSAAPYDVLYAANVLEHLKNPERVLAEAHALLKPEGIAVVVLPNIAHWQFRLRLLLGKFDYEDYGVMDRTHTRLYTVKSGGELLAKQGFRVEQLVIAGSLVQNMLHATARRLGRHAALPPILPGLLAYELIFLARRV